MAADHIRYDLLAQDALRGVVRKVLSDAAKHGLPGDHHFFVTFDTCAEGVRLSQRMRAQYPKEMTIVLQHQFWDLVVSEEGFEVGLSFGGIPERLSVPFAAVKQFHDPSVEFGLQFEQIGAAPEATARPAPPASPAAKRGRETDSGENGTARAQSKSRRAAPAVPSVPISADAPTDASEDRAGKPNQKPNHKTTDKPGGKSAEVVRLDRFRKK
jgi:uncharacterized protein